MKTAGIVGALVVVCMAAGVQASSLLNTNLIRNPGAESDAGADGHAVVSPSEWLAGGNITVVNYAAVADSGYFPLSFTGSGDNFFAGGPSNASSIAMQTTDLSAIGSLIDSGHASFTLSGYLGGWSEREDNATLTANFRDAGGESRSVTIGPITGYDRAYQTGFVFCSESGRFLRGHAALNSCWR
jgi:hypothetical protein